MDVGEFNKFLAGFPIESEQQQPVTATENTIPDLDAQILALQKQKEDREKRQREMEERKAIQTIQIHSPGVAGEPIHNVLTEIKDVLVDLRQHLGTLLEREIHNTSYVYRTVKEPKDIVKDHSLGVYLDIKPGVAPKGKNVTSRNMVTTGELTLSREAGGGRNSRYTHAATILTNTLATSFIPDVSQSTGLSIQPTPVLQTTNPTCYAQTAYQTSCLEQTKNMQESSIHPFSTNVQKTQLCSSEMVIQTTCIGIQPSTTILQSSSILADLDEAISDFKIKNVSETSVIPAQTATTNGVFILFSMSTGTGVTMVVTMLHNEVETKIHNQKAGNIGVQLNHTEFSSAGLYPVKVNASNSLGQSLLYFVVAVQNEVGVPVYEDYRSPVYVEVDKDFIIPFRDPLMVDQGLVWILTSSDSNVTQIRKQNCTSDNISYKISKVGNVSLEFASWNFVTFRSERYNLISEYVPNSLQLNVTKSLVDTNNSIVGSIEIMVDSVKLPMGQVNCTLDFGDGTTNDYRFSFSSLNPAENTSPTAPFNHNYSVSGQYTWTLTCKNEVGEINATADITVLDLLSGVTIVNETGSTTIAAGNAVNDGVRFIVRIASGSDLNIDVRLLKTGAEVNLFHEQSGDHLIAFNSSEFSSYGLYLVFVNVSSLLDKTEICAVLAVQKNIAGISFDQHAVLEVEVGDEILIPIHFSIESEISMVLEVANSDNNVTDVYYERCHGSVSDHEISLSVKIGGESKVTVQAWNIVSHYDIPGYYSFIGLYQPNSLTLDITNATSYFFNNITFQAGVSQTASVPMGTAQCSFDFGDGETVVRNFDIQTLDKVFTDVVHKYNTPGNYNFTLNCSNTFGSFVSQSDIVLVEKIGSISIINNTDSVIVITDADTLGISFNLSVSAGTHMQSDVRLLATGSTASFLDLPGQTFLTHFNVSEITATGFYAVDVFIKNPLDQETASYVFVSQKELSDISHSFVGYPEELAYVEYNSSLGILLGLEQGYDVTFTWIMLDRNKDTISIQIQRCSGAVASHQISTNFISLGAVELTLVAWNYVSHVSKSLNFFSAYAINSFNYFIRNETTYTFNEIEFEVEIAHSAYVPMGIVTCLLDFGDSTASIQTILNVSIFSMNKSLGEIKQHTYAEYGSFNLTVNCTNEIGSQYKLFPILIVNKIENVDLTNGSGSLLIPASKARQSGLTIQATILNGSHLDMSATLVAINVTNRTWYLEAREYSVMFGPSDIFSTGLFAVDVDIKNPLSEFSSTVIFLVHEDIDTFTYTGFDDPFMYVEAHAEFDLRLFFVKGSDLTFVWKMTRAGELVFTQIQKCEEPVTSKDQSLLPNTGNHTLTLHAWNLVSHITKTYLFFSEYKLNSIFLGVTNQTAFFENNITFEITISMNASLPMGIVECMLDFGENTDMTYTSFNMVGSVLNEDYASTIYVRKYETHGNYTCNFTCRNEIDAFSQQYMMILVDLINDVNLTTDSGSLIGQASAAGSVGVSFPIGVQRGSHMLLSVVVISSNNSVIRYENDPGIFDVSLSASNFLLTGLYAIDVKLENPLSVYYSSLVYIVQEPFSGISFSGLADDFTYYAVNSTIELTVGLDEGSDVSYLWTLLNDGQIVFVNFQTCRGLVRLHQIQPFVPNTGNHTLTLDAWNVVSHISKTYQFFIEYKLNSILLGVTNQTAFFENNITFEIRISRKASLPMGIVQCMLDFGDNTNMTYTYFNMAGSVLNEDYASTIYVRKYETHGNYTCNFTCRNEIDAFSQQYMMILVDLINDVNLTTDSGSLIRHASAAGSVGVSFPISVQRGSHMLLSVVVISSNNSVIRYENDPDIFDVSFSASNFLLTGLYAIDMKLENPLSVYHSSLVYIVQEPFSGISFSGLADDFTYYAVNSTIELEVRLDEGSDVSFFWTLLKDGQKVFVNIQTCRGLVRLHQIQPFVPDTGNHTLTLDAWNVVSHISKTFQFFIEHKLNSILFGITNQTAFFENNITFEITISMNASLPMGIVQCMLDFGDNTNMTYTYFNMAGSILNEDYVSTVYVRKYETHGNYTCNFTCRNEIDAFSHQYMMILVDLISNVNLTTDSWSLIRHASAAGSVGVSFPISVQRGSHMLLSVVVISSNNSVIRYENDPDIFDVSFSASNFLLTGLYAIDVKLENPLSVYHSSLVYIVQEPFSGISFSGLADDFTYYAVNSTIELEVGLDEGSDVSFLWTLLKDGQIVFVNFQTCRGLVRLHQIQPFVPDTGNHTLTLDAWNVVSHISKTYQFFIEYKLNSILFGITNQTAFFENNITFEITVSMNASLPMGIVKCMLDFGDNTNMTYTYFNMAGSILNEHYVSTVYVRTYETHGNYTCNFTCRNEIDAFSQQYMMILVDLISNVNLTTDSGSLIRHAPAAGSVGVSFPISVQRGSHMLLSVVVISSNNSVIRYENDPDIFDVSFSASNFLLTGLYAIDVKLENPLSVYHSSLVYIVQEPFSGISFSGLADDFTYYAVNSTIELEVGLDEGSDVSFLWTLLKNGQIVFVNFQTCRGLVRLHQIQPFVPDTGNHTLTLDAWNVVSHISKTYQFFIEYKLNSILFGITNQTAFFENNITFEITVSMNASLPMGIVKCMLDFGDNTNMTYTYFNMAGSILNEHYVSTVYVRKYETHGNYTCNFTCRNEIDAFSQQYMMILVDLISNVNLTTDSGSLIRHAPAAGSVGVSFPISVQRGSHILASIVVISSNNSVIRYENDPGIYGVSFSALNFLLTGFYVIDVKFVNPLSVYHSSLVYIVQEPFLGISFSGLADDFTYYAVNSTIRLEVGLDEGSEVSFLWTLLNNDQIVFVKFQTCGGLVRLHKIQPIVLTPGTLKLDLEMWNLNNRERKQFSFFAEYNLNSIDLHIHNVTSFYYENITFEIEIYEDALVPMGNVSCAIDFGDFSNRISVYYNLFPSELNLDELLQSVVHKYDAYGDYACNFSCKNEIGSFLRSYNMTMVEPISGVDVMNRTGSLVMPNPNARSSGAFFEIYIRNGSHLDMKSELVSSSEIVHLWNMDPGWFEFYFEKENFISTGMHAVDIRIDNPLSEFQTSIILVVHETINDFKASTEYSEPYIHLEVNSSLEITVNFSSGSNLTFLMAVSGYGKSTHFMQGCNDTIISHHLNLPYVMPGEVMLYLNVWNYISYRNENFGLFYEYRLNSISTNIINATVFYFNTVTFEIKIATMASMPMGDVECTMDFGDNTPTNITQIDMRGLDLSGVPLSINIVHKYETYGDYIYTFMCENDISSFTKLFNMTVVDAITGVDTTNGTGFMVVPAPKARIEGVVIYLNITTGSHMKINVSLLGTRGSVIYENALYGIHKVAFSSDIFQAFGLYIVEIDINNPLDSFHDYLVLSVEDEITIASLASTDGKERVIEVEKFYNIDLHYSSASNVAIFWSHTNSTTDYKYVDVHGVLCSGSVTSTTLSYNVISRGNVSFNIDVYNTISHHTNSKNYFSEFQLNSLEVDIEYKISFVGQPVRFNLQTFQNASYPMGSVQCTLEYGDNHTDSSTLDFTGLDLDSTMFRECVHTYTKPGNYTFKIYYQNELGSEEGLDQNVTIENPVNIKVEIRRFIPRSSPVYNVTATVVLTEEDKPISRLHCSFEYSDDSNVTTQTDQLSAEDPISSSHTFDKIKAAGTSYKPTIYEVTLNCSTFLNYSLIPTEVEIFTDCFDVEWTEDGEVIPTLFIPRRNRTCPMQWFTTDKLTVKATLVLTGQCIKEEPIFEWNITWVINDTYEELIQPSKPYPSSVALSIPQETLYPGLYRIDFRATYETVPGRGSTVSDTYYVNMKLPDIVVSIAGSTEFYVSNKGSHVIDASASYDPVQKLDVCDSRITEGGCTETVKDELHHTWHCYCINGNENETVGQETVEDLMETKVSNYIANFPNSDISTESSCSGMSSNNDITLHLNMDDLVRDNTCVWFVFVLDISRAARKASAICALKPVENEPLVVGIVCRGKNCPVGNQKKIAARSLELDAADTGFSYDKLVYKWTIRKKESNDSEFIDVSDKLVSDTGLDKKGIRINDGNLKLGTKYQIQLEVEHTDNSTRGPGFAKDTWTTNYKPYGGYCALDKLDGRATVDTFTLECFGWKDEGYRTEQNSIEDENPNLEYVIFQETEGDIIQTEPLFKSFSSKALLHLKMGNRLQNYKSALHVRISDGENFEQSVFNITVRPQLSNVSEDDAAIVNQFMENVTNVLDEGKELNDSSFTVSLTTSIVSQISSVEVPEEEEPISTDINESPGGLLDKPADYEKPLNFTDLMELIKPATPGPLALAVQEAAQNLSTTINKVLTGNEEGEIPATLTQQLSASMVGLLGKEHQNANNATMGIIVSGLLRMTTSIGNDSVSGLDDALNELQNLGSHLIGAMVPANLKNRQLNMQRDFLREILRNAQVLEGGNVTDLLEDTLISEDERVFIFQRMQELLNIEIEEDKQHARGVAEGLVNVAQKNLANAMICGGCSKELKTENFNQRIETDDGDILAGKEISAPTEASKVKLDGLSGNGGNRLSVSVSTFSDNVFFYDSDGTSSLVTSEIGHVDIVANGKDKILQTEFLFVQNVVKPMPTTVIPTIYSEDASQFSAHVVQVRTTGDFLCLVVEPLDNRIIKYELYFKFASRPSIIDFDIKEEVGSFSSWKICLSPVQLAGHVGLMYLGIKAFGGQSESNRKKRDAGNGATSAVELAEDPVYSPYNFSAITASCMVWDDSVECWHRDKCDLEWYPNRGQIECSCKNVEEITFGNSFFVAPNTIDFSTVFLKFSPLNQAAVIGAIAAVLVIYVLLLIWARRQDKKDILKWGVTSLADNFSDDNYYYILRVFTGLRPNAGTRSKISFVVCGEEDDTGVRTLYDGVRKEFSTGSVINLLLATHSPLGYLQYLRVWHDNSGGGNYSSWYLSKIEVWDVQRNESFTFMCEKWFAIDEEDCILEHLLPVTHEENLSNFRNRFYHSAKSNLADNHIWISLMYRPVTSCFTRVQRVSCAIVFVMLTMISNAMYYNPEDNYESPATFRVGPFYFSLKQIYTSVICALITTPSTLLLVFIFKNCKRKHNPESFINKNRAQTESAKKSQSSAAWPKRLQSESITLEERLIAPGTPNFPNSILPSYFLLIGWFLVICGILVPGFFVVLFSMEWGKQKSEEWITSFLLSFLESVLVLDPIKVLLMAMTVAIICRSINQEYSIIDRATIIKNYTSARHAHSNGVRLPAPPLCTDAIEKARQRRLKEIQLQTTLRDIVVNLFFLWIILSISYSNRDELSYQLHREITTSLLQQKGSFTFGNVSTTAEYYRWLNETAFPKLFPENDIHGNRLHWRLRQFTDGFINYRLGPPRLRQLRTKHGICDIPKIGRVDCYEAYAVQKEDTDSYCAGWKEQPCDSSGSAIAYSPDAWIYTSAGDIWGLPVTGEVTTYGGGGYIAKMDVNKEITDAVLQELYDEVWIDRHTRAVFLEFTLYCIDANIFLYNMFLVEFPATGGALTFYSIQPLRLYQHVGPLGMYTLACEVIFLIGVVCMTVYTVVRIITQRLQFFKDGWQVLDFVGLLVSYVAIGMFIGRIILVDETIAKFQDDRKQFVNFVHVAVWNEMLVLFIGCLVFLACIRFINIFGSSKRMKQIAGVFSYSAADLFWFGLMFVFMYVLYAVFGYLLFGSSLESYRNVYRTLGTLFISMIGKSRFTEIDQTDPVMAKLYFMAFILFMVYLVMTMFLSILTSSINAVHQESKNDTSQELMIYMLNKIKQFFGVHMDKDIGFSTKGRRQDMKTAPSFEKDGSFEILHELRGAFAEACSGIMHAEGKGIRKYGQNHQRVRFKY